MNKKDTCILAGLNIYMRPVLNHAQKILDEIGQEFVVTSGLDGVHGANSLHYYGLAIDIRTRHLSESEKTYFVNMLRSELKEVSSNYEVILHSTHLHVEYDKKEIL